jgi:hypothetical protein
MDDKLLKRWEKAKAAALAYLASEGYEGCTADKYPGPLSPEAAVFYIRVEGWRRTPRGVPGKWEAITVAVHRRGYHGLTLIPSIEQTEVLW